MSPAELRGTCRAPTRTHALAGNDLGFATRVRRELHTKHSSFIKPLTHTSAFGVKHFAGDVLYHTSGFCETVRFACVDACLRCVRCVWYVRLWLMPGQAAQQAPLSHACTRMCMHQAAHRFDRMAR